MKFSKLILLLAVVFFVFSAPPLFAKDTMTIAVNVNPPWIIHLSGDQLEGAEIEMFKHIMEKLNCEMKFEIAPFKRCLYYMENGKADMMVGIFRRPEREVYIEYVEPNYKNKSNKSFYVLKGKKGELRTYEDLYKFRIGIKNGVKYFPKFDQDAKLKKEAVNEHKLNYKKLIFGRIDTFIISSAQGDYILRNEGFEDQIEKAEFGYSKTNPVYLGISKKSPWMNRIGEIKTLIREMIESGTLDQIFTDYFKRNGLPVPDYK